MTHRLLPSLLRQPLSNKLFLLLFIGSVGFPALSQSFAYHAPETNSIQEKGQLSLKDALLNLENRFQVVLGYKKNLVHNQTVADGTWQQEKDFELALKELLEPLNLMYKKIGDKTYVIKAKPKETSPQKSTSWSQPLEGLPAEEGSSTPTASVDQSPSTDITVTGRVTAQATGEGLPGVSILARGSTNGTTTDADGAYSIRISDPKTVLSFSYIGYVTEEVTVGAQTTINVSLTADIKALSEVVVVGYGTQKRSDLTGSVGSVSEKELKKVSMASLDQGLQGRVAGVQVSQTGQPGGGVNILIRGQNSISSGNAPLYVIDGFPITNDQIADGKDVSDFRASGSQNPLAGINPNDIESIEILKDASATAIYGSRGANGVIMITTKRGKPGKASVDYQGYYGVQQVGKTLDLMTSAEYANLYNEAAEADGKTKLFGDGELPAPDAITTNTDWQDEVFRLAPIQDHQLSIAGGNEFGRYLVSGNYYDQQGILLGSGLKRGSLRSNVDFEFLKRVKVGTSLMITRSTKDVAQIGGNRLDGHVSTTASALTVPSYLPVRLEDGSYAQFNISGISNLPRDNAVAISNELTDDQSDTRILASAYASVEILKGLTFRISLGGDLTNSERNFYVPRTLVEGANKNGYATVTTRRNQSWLNENILSYDRVLNKHTINLVGGYTVQKAQNNLTSIETSKFGTDRFGTHNLSAGELPGIPTTNFSEWSLLSYLGRLNYTFNDKYLLTLTARTDGSSTFGENNKWSFFPSAAVAWKLGNEPFIQNLGVFEQLKLRASYGITGNSGGPYKSIALLENTNYVYGGQLVIGYYPGGITNPDLRWETVSVLDIGLDMSFLRDRISVTADYYHKISRDLLLGVAVPSVSGYSTALLNAGSLENRGVEISANAVVVESPLKWVVGGNFSINRNKLLSLGDAKEVIGTRVIGQPLGLVLGYQYDGVFQNEEQLRAGPVQKGDVLGNARYVDQNGDGTINAEDRVIIGNTNPDFIYGLNNTLSYKNLELSLFLQGMYGHDVENLTYNVLSRMDPNTNQLRAVAQRRWTPENPDTDVPRAAFGTSNRANLNSTRNIEKGSYLRVRSVRLTYNLNLAKFFKTSRIYLSGQNVYTFTRYSGVNPELSSEEYAYPLAKIYTVGLELGF